ncbi:MAG: hypothetical protein ACRYG8_43060 [Janthinobacterium lividum]
MQKPGRKVGAYSSPDALDRLDMRSAEGRFMAQTRADLIRHVGGKPSATQAALIHRAAWLTLHIAKLDAKMTTSGELSDLDDKTYLSWSNSLTRTLKALGMKAAETAPPDLKSYIASRAAQAAA